MRVSRDWLRCVMFLCVDRNIDLTTECVPIATAFLVRLTDSDDKSISWKYLVTARHVIEDKDDTISNDRIYIRANLLGGGCKEWPTDRKDWIIHDNADVAIINFVSPIKRPDEIDHLTIPLDMFVTKDYGYYGPPIHNINRKAWVHIGDEVFFIGLFTAHTGTGRNLPIVRFGNISAMPTEPIKLHRWSGTTEFEALAYLAECRSWGGHSGSPAFWAMPVAVGKGVKDLNIISWETEHIVAFLGLVSAHFDIPKEARHTGDILGKIKTDINAGIAAITPSEAICQLLMREDLIKMRQEQKKAIQSQRPRATLDIGQVGFKPMAFHKLDESPLLQPPNTLSKQAHLT